MTLAQAFVGYGKFSTEVVRLHLNVCEVGAWERRHPACSSELFINAAGLEALSVSVQEFGACVSQDGCDERSRFQVQSG